jgi:BolA protein
MSKMDITPMSRQLRLEKLLRTAFPQAVFQLFDDSREHAGHAYGESGETHDRLRIVDDSFQGEKRVQSERRIFKAIKPEFDAGLHSFVIEDISSRPLA